MKIFAALCLSLMMLSACSDDSGAITVTDATTDTAIGDTNGNNGSPAYYGFVTIERATVSAAFRALPRHCTLESESSGCRVSECVRPTGSFASAAAITLTGLQAGDVTMNPKADGSYDEYAGADHMLGSEQIIVSAEGDVVASFTGTVDGVAAVTTSEPPYPDAGPVTFNPAEDVTFSWTGGTNGQVVAQFRADTQSSSHFDEYLEVECAADVSTGSLLLPKEVLQQVAATTGAVLFNLRVTNRSSVTSGNAEVALDATTLATTATGVEWSSTVTFE
jgi:hypothetical protein